MTMPKPSNDWRGRVRFWQETGSRVICDPAPTDTDQDFICFTPNSDATIDSLKAIGFCVEGAPGFYTGSNAGNFVSLRRGDENIILTDRPRFYDLFVAATYLAKRFNLTEKADRIALFQLVLYGVTEQNLQRRMK